MSNVSIQKLDKNERPREKFITKGCSSLSNAELLAIILRSGTREENVIDLARRILSSSNNCLGELLKYNLEDLMSFKGIGQGKALSIMAVFELFKRAQLEKVPHKSIIYSSTDAFGLISPILSDLNYEECWILYLNRANRLIVKEKLSQGGLTATVIDVKLIIKRAIEKLASSLILVHNHPSGNSKPGEQDIAQTKKLRLALEVCDIHLLDHLIVAGRDFYSFADEGLL